MQSYDALYKSSKRFLKDGPPKNIMKASIARAPAKAAADIRRTRRSIMGALKDDVYSAKADNTYYYSLSIYVNKHREQGERIKILRFLACQIPSGFMPGIFTRMEPFFLDMYF